ncbi:DUF3368 domain-containing protein [bacterium]|nr:DUF3368 domain-containing protein [bacterium]MBU1754380.1 DUF3368 domain-containing protein [bacterium]
MEVISNSGPLMALGKLNLLYLLKRLYGKVIISDSVYKETVTAGKIKGAQDALTIELFLTQNKWNPVEVNTKEIDPEIRLLRLDDGEIESIHLAMKISNSLILLDDEEARKEARRKGLKIKGTIGVLVEAYQRDMINLEELKLFLNEISERRDIWISKELCQTVLMELKK